MESFPKVTFHRCGHLQEFNIEEGPRFVGKVFFEEDAIRISEALNTGHIVEMKAFVRGLKTVGLGDHRSAEVLLALVRQGANLFVE